MIATLGWRWLIKESKFVVEFVILEFYANISNAIDYMVDVQGVVVPFGPLDTNAYYGLMNIGQGEYETYLSNMDHAAMIEVLAIEEVE